MAWRGKAIQGRPANRLRVVAIDGHETFASAARCCHQCLIREETRDGQPIKIYYHRIVVAQWVGVTPPAILDIEPVLPGEGEVVAAKRMLPRLLAAYGRLIDVFTVDSLYLEGPFLQQVYDAGKHFVAVMKQESRDLYQDSEQLRQTFPPQVVQEGTRTLSLWDIPNLTTFPTFGHPVRVVCSFEQEKKKIIRGGHKESVVEDHQWRWVTDLPVDQVSATQIARFGHDRWDEENRGFNELDHLWGLDHCFVHDPVAILVILLTLAIAFLTTYLFYERNCQPAVRARITRETFSIDLREGFATDRGPSLWSASPDTS
jgi:hypothetical protein